LPCIVKGVSSVGDAKGSLDAGGLYVSNYGGGIVAYGLAADGETDVRPTLDLLQREVWTTLGHLGCLTVAELSSGVRAVG
jgi:isopentenyl diphosphate isomerase/L-lactate dehydrogenase-like FMN-dependent dehydrogenase